MNLTQTNKFKEYVRTNQQGIRSSLKTHAGRSLDEQEANYLEIKERLKDNGITNIADVEEGAKIIRDILNCVVEIKKPPADNGASRKLATLKSDASEVTATIAGVYVQLDCDQLKHQPPGARIGSRDKGGGNKFVDTCDGAWHQANTMAHMAAWANLQVLKEGDQKFHGQATPVDGIHYEGFCLLAGGKKYVSFHCYPANDSPLKYVKPKGT